MSNKKNSTKQNSKKVTVRDNYKKKNKLRFVTKTTITELSNGQEQFTYHISMAKKKTFMTVEDITDIYDVAVEMLGTKKLVLRTHSAIGSYTMKSLNGEISLMGIDEYLEGALDLNRAQQDYTDNFYSIDITHIE